MKQPLDRCRSAIGTAEHHRVIAIGKMGLNVLLLAAGSEEAKHGALAVGPFDPFVLGAELKFRKIRLSCNEVDRVYQSRRIDPIERRTRRPGLDIHGCLLVWSSLDVRAYRSRSFERAWKPWL